jgi:hypothetical protein
MNDTANSTHDVAAEVDLVLKRAGLAVSDEERERLIRLYPTVQGWGDQLRLAETRYAEPALIYEATDRR